MVDFFKKYFLFSKVDWDAFETSWNFQRHPFIRATPTVANAFAQWEIECNERFNQLKANEEELNRIFIDIYGLQDELTPEVEDKDVTVRKADLQRDIKSLLSYAVGCMFGRYSLDSEGLAYAGGDWDESKYKTFLPDVDGILPITAKKSIWGRYCYPPVQLAENCLWRRYAGRKSGLHCQSPRRQRKQQPGDHP